MFLYLTMKQFYKHIYFLTIILGMSITWGQDCDEGNPDWPSNDGIASGYEFILYITAEIFIDSINQENGKIAGFVGGQIRGTDIDGASYFPPSDKWLYQFPIYSNQVEGETIFFKFYDEINNVIIDLNESYEFISDGIIGDAFNPFILTGSCVIDNYILGDINGDEVLDILDVVLMINIILNNEYSVVADVNEDGSVDILDVVLMVNILLGGLPQSN